MELVIELFQTFQSVLKLLLGQDQGSDSEMIGAWFLSEATSWHQSNSCVLQNLKTIEKIRGLISGGLNSFLREFYLRECVH